MKAGSDLRFSEGDVCKLFTEEAFDNVRLVSVSDPAFLALDFDLFLHFPTTGRRLPGSCARCSLLAATSKKHQLATSERRNTEVRAPGRGLSRIHHKFRLIIVRYVLFFPSISLDVLAPELHCSERSFLSAHNLIVCALLCFELVHLR